MSKLLVRPTERDKSGRVLSITPESANWEYIGFEVYKLKPGEVLEQYTGDQEVCLVLVSGRANVSTGDNRWENIGERMGIFEKKTPPYAVYIPNDSEFRAEATTDLELAVCKAPGFGNHKARLIEPDKKKCSIRGEGTNTRFVQDILPDTEAADSLLVVEVYTPAGHWSSYPPHKHSVDNLPEESSLEETYYHRINPSQGFAFQRVYTDDRRLDETISVEDGCVVMVPEGYHPVGAPHGYELYYLNVMAGPKRVWKFKNDPEHEWLMKK